jgi:hypothetical protein
MPLNFEQKSVQSCIFDYYKCRKLISVSHRSRSLFAKLAAISNCMSEINKEVQNPHKILSVDFKFSEVIHYVLAVGRKLNWFLVSAVILKFIIHIN